MPERSDSPDDDNQSRKRHLPITNNNTPSKRAKPSALGAFLAPFSSLFGMFRGGNKQRTESIHEVSDDEGENTDDEIVVVSTSPKKVEPNGPIVFLNADPPRTVAGADEIVFIGEKKDDDVVVEKHIQRNVEVSDDSDENSEVQIVEPTQIVPQRPVFRTCEVQQDDDLTVQFVKLVQTPNRDLQNARMIQNEIIFLNETQDDDASSVQFDTTEAAVFASPTPEESVSRPRTPNDWSLSSPCSRGTRNVRDYWRRSASKRPTNKQFLIRQPNASTVVKKFATSQIQKPARQQPRGLQETSLSRYMKSLVQCGYIDANTSIEIGKDNKKKSKGKTSASDLISKAKMTVAGINGSRSCTPSILSRESSVVSLRTPAGAQTPSSSSDFGSTKSENLSQMLSKLQTIQLNSEHRVGGDRYKSVYETNKRKVENLGEELRIRGGYREQTKEDRFESVRKDLELRGIVIRPKPVKKVKDEFMPLPDSVDLLIEKAWTKALNQDEKFVDAFDIPIARKDLITLCGLSWLNDNIINYYLQLICQRSKDESNYPKVYAFNTFFYTNIVTKGYASVKRWTRKVDIFAHDVVLVPVHLGMHWCMAVIDFPRKRLEFYDSLYNGNMEVLPALRSYIASESMDKKKVPFDFNEWTVEQMEDIPRQKNGSDCGVFSCQFGEWASRRKAPEFTQKNMPYYRKRMVHEIVSKQLLASL